MRAFPYLTVFGCVRMLLFEFVQFSRSYEARADLRDVRVRLDGKEVRAEAGKA